MATWIGVVDDEKSQLEVCRIIRNPNRTFWEFPNTTFISKTQGLVQKRLYLYVMDLFRSWTKKFYGAAWWKLRYFSQTTYFMWDRPKTKQISQKPYQYHGCGNKCTCRLWDGRPNEGHYGVWFVTNTTRKTYYQRGLSDCCGRYTSRTSPMLQKVNEYYPMSRVQKKIPFKGYSNQIEYCWIGRRGMKMVDDDYVRALYRDPPLVLGSSLRTKNSKSSL